MQGYYPDYDVMSLVDEWDSHTKEIVKRRLGPYPDNKFLDEHEARTVRVISEHLVYDNRDEILNYVVHHMDSKLAGEIGEDQRKSGTPKEQDLIRYGLKAMDNLSRKLYSKDFVSADVKQQFSILELIQKGRAPEIPDWSKAPQKKLFKKLLSTVVEAYYSHPRVWSEIGYGGPAYPRGYVRVELGLTDPWEAKRGGE